jgi:hypothetical protein
MPATNTISPRGPVPNINGATAFFPSDRPATEMIQPAVNDLVATINDVEATYQPERQGDALDRRIGPFLSASRAAIAAMLANAKETAAADMVVMTPPPAIADAAATRGPEIRRRLIDLPGPALHAALLRADVVTLTAAREMDWGMMVNVLPETRAAIDERLAVLYHIERAGMGAARPALADADGRILAVGTDSDAVYADAEAALERHKARLAGVEADEGIAHGLVSLAAAALKIERKAALSRIQAAA